MIEEFSGFPRVLSVASGAFCAELALMWILMALVAFALHSEERLVLVFHPDLCRLNFYLRARVTTLARERTVLAL